MNFWDHRISNRKENIEIRKGITSIFYSDIFVISFIYNRIRISMFTTLDGTHNYL